MATVNSCTFVGRLGARPELRTLNDDVKVAKLRLAVSSRKKDGETLWLDVSVWRGNAEFAANYLDKGNQVLVEGRLMVRKFKRADGSEGTAVEIDAHNLVGLEPKTQSGKDEEPF